jgi:competence protein ComEA
MFKNLFAVILSTLLLAAGTASFADTTSSNPGTPAATTSAPSASSKTKDSTAIVNINTADVKALQTLKGVGPKRSAAIVAYRTQNGPFTSIQDLLKVKGIPQSVINENITRLTTAG